MKAMVMGVSMLAAGAVWAAPAENNLDLYGSTLYNEQAHMLDLTQRTDNPDLYGWVVRDRTLKAEAEKTRVEPFGFGDSYGNVLFDVGTDPWGEISDETERELKGGGLNR